MKTSFKKFEQNCHFCRGLDLFSANVAENKQSFLCITASITSGQCCLDTNRSQHKSHQVCSAYPYDRLSAAIQTDGPTETKAICNFCVPAWRKACHKVESKNRPVLIWVPRQHGGCPSCTYHKKYRKTETSTPQGPVFWVGTSASSAVPHLYTAKQP